MAFQPLVNGEAYSWAQITLGIDGVAVAGIKAISYGENQTVVNNYGAGRFPVSRGYGAVEVTGSITLEMTDVEAIQRAAPNGRIQDYPEFPVTVSFVPLNGGGIVTHRLNNCRFMENKRDMSQGDTSVDVELPLLPSHITWNA